MKYQQSSYTPSFGSKSSFGYSGSRTMVSPAGILQQAYHTGGKAPANRFTRHLAGSRREKQATVHWGPNLPRRDTQGVVFHTRLSRVQL